jgi:hypothetical protein
MHVAKLLVPGEFGVGAQDRVIEGDRDSEDLPRVIHRSPTGNVSSIRNRCRQTLAPMHDRAAPQGRISPRRRRLVGDPSGSTTAGYNPSNAASPRKLTADVEARGV